MQAFDLSRAPLVAPMGRRPADRRSGDQPRTGPVMPTLRNRSGGSGSGGTGGVPCSAGPWRGAPRPRLAGIAKTGPVPLSVAW